MAHPLADFDIPGIAAGRRARLEEAGYSTLEQLAAADPATLSEIPHIHISLAQSAIQAAKDLLANIDTDPAPEAVEPTMESVEPTMESAEPDTEATYEPAAEAEEPAVEAIEEPVVEAIEEAAAEPEEPAAEVEEPAVEREEPAVEAIEEAAVEVESLPEEQTEEIPVSEVPAPIAEPVPVIAEPSLSALVREPEDATEEIPHELFSQQRLGDDIDRVSPGKRPDRRNAGHQKWRELLFLHWPIPMSELRPLIPAQLNIDTFDGVAYIGLVPFAMLGVKPRWMPFGMDFLETNVRTYVHLDGKDPGVWFFSLEAASWLAVKAARAGWNLPYHHARMRADHNGDVLRYSTIRVGQPAATSSASFKVGPELPASEPGTLQHFLLERYYLYSRSGTGHLMRGQVHHPPYPAHSVELRTVSDGLISAAGLPKPKGLPPLAHFSPGVDVEVFGLERV